MFSCRLPADGSAAGWEGGGGVVRRGRLGRGPSRCRDPGRDRAAAGQGAAARGRGRDRRAARAGRRAPRRRTAEAGDRCWSGSRPTAGRGSQALIAAGYTVYAVNPLQVARYRERHAHVGGEERPRRRARAGRDGPPRPPTSCGRSPGTARWPRRQGRRPGAPDDDLGPAPAHAAAARRCCGSSTPPRWTRSTTWPPPTRWRCSATAPDPAAAARLTRSRIAARAAAGRPPQPRGQGRADPGRAARRAAGPAAGRGRRLRRHGARPGRGDHRAHHRRSTCCEEQVEACFGQHPDAEIYLSQPGLGTILGARVLAEFGDDPDRYADAQGPQELRRHAARSPAPPARRRVVLARYARNRPPRRRPPPAGLLRPDAPHPAPAPTTTGTAPAAPPTTPLCASSPTASSASSTAASRPHPLRRAHRLGHHQTKINNAA